MKVREIMNKDVKFVNKDRTALEVAQLMRDNDIGSVPIEENDKLVGMVTDRDLTLRILAEGKDPKTRIAEFAQGEIKYCFDDEEVEEVASQMSNLKVRRMPVMSREKRLVGIVSLGDLASKSQSQDAAADTLAHVSS